VNHIGHGFTLAFFVVEDKWTMAEVQDFMEADKALFNLHVKNRFTGTLRPKS
jgi:hypothetical protein